MRGETFDLEGWMPTWGGGVMPITVERMQQGVVVRALQALPGVPVGSLGEVRMPTAADFADGMVPCWWVDWRDSLTGRPASMPCRVSDLFEADELWMLEEVPHDVVE